METSNVKKSVCKDSANRTELYKRRKNTILFGTYPQTRVTDNSIISELSLKAGELPTISDNKLWTSYGYYFEGSVSNYMWYVDLSLNGVKYRGVYFTSCRPHWCASCITAYTYQDDNGYKISTVYWFKYEPIKWKILDEIDGKALILANFAIDSQQFYHNHNDRTKADNIVYANNYVESEIRKWLNDVFYNTAFSSEQKEVIQTTEVDNSVSSIGYNRIDYACENTFDKIFLLSYAEIVTYFSANRSRQAKSTDYAKSQGCCSDNDCKSNCVWRLRSPYYTDGIHTRCIDYNGNFYYNLVDSTSYGILPALVISLFRTSKACDSR